MFSISRVILKVHTVYNLLYVVCFVYVLTDSLLTQRNNAYVLVYTKGGNFL